MRLTAAQALEHPWLDGGDGGAEGDPLQGSVVQRLQRFATYSFLKQLVLKIIIDDMQGGGGQELPPMLTALRDLFNKLDIDASGALLLTTCPATPRQSVALSPHAHEPEDARFTTMPSH